MLPSVKPSISFCDKRGVVRRDARRFATMIDAIALFLQQLLLSNTAPKK